MNEFELKILDWIQSVFQCSFLDAVIPVFTHLGDAVTVILLAVVLILFKKTRKMGLSAGIALLIGVIIGNLIFKNAVGRIRPFEINTEFSILVERLTDGSFPSGHSLACFEVATAFFINNKKVGIFSFIAATLVAFCRLYLYVHFPTDVLGGIAMGIIFGIVASYIVNKIYEKYSDKFPKILT